LPCGKSFLFVGRKGVAKGVRCGIIALSQ